MPKVDLKVSLSNNDINDIANLYLNWPYDKYRYHRFLLPSERRRIFLSCFLENDNEERFFFFFREWNKLKSVCLIKALQWDSENFNIPMFSLVVLHDPCLTERCLKEYVHRLMEKISELFHSFHLSVQVDSEDYCLINALVSFGFLFLDQKRTFLVRKNNQKVFVRKVLPVRRFEKKDEAAVFSLLQGVSFPSRFSRDPMLSAERVHAMYRSWTHSLMHPKTEMEPSVVVERKGEIVAFAAGREVKAVTDLTEKRLCGESLYFSSENGVGGYVSVIDWLINNTVNHYDALELVISSGNLPAQRVLQRFGLMPAASQFSLHYDSNL